MKTIVLPNTSPTLIKIRDGISRYGERYRWKKGGSLYKIVDAKIYDPKHTLFYVEEIMG